jgi:hypothetical protein
MSTIGIISHHHRHKDFEKQKCLSAFYHIFELQVTFKTEIYDIIFLTSPVD